MQLKKHNGEIFVPDGLAVEEALKRTTHMAIAAHQDDIEIMAADGILKCFGRNDCWFTGVVVTNGSGSARDYQYASYTDEEMQKVRMVEQKKAAYVGEYAAQVLMMYPSGEIKDPSNDEVVEELKQLLIKSRPRVVYTHNPADKHETHIATLVKVIKAIRELPEELKPEAVYGCEVWRNLDWVNDDEKVVFDVSERENVSAALLGVFDSQICGGKRYDLAAMGRRRANATFSSSHATDKSSALSYAVDLTPVVKDVEISLSSYIVDYIKRFADDVAGKIEKFTR